MYIPIYTLVPSDRTQVTDHGGQGTKVVSGSWQHLGAFPTVTSREPEARHKSMEFLRQIDR